MPVIAFPATARQGGRSTPNVIDRTTCNLNEEKTSKKHSPVVIVISGPPGAGKTSISTLISHQFQHAAHLQADVIRAFVAHGEIPSLPIERRPDSKLKLLQQNVCCLATNFIEEGYTVVIDDLLGDPAVYHECLPSLALTVFLRPSLKTCLARNQQPRGKSFDTDALIDLIHETYSRYDIATLERRWDAILDTTDQTPAAVVDEILERLNRSAEQ